MVYIVFFIFIEVLIMLFINENMFIGHQLSPILELLLIYLIINILKL